MTAGPLDHVARNRALQAPPGVTTRYEYTTGEWGRRWPSEEVWRARKRA